MKPDVMALFGKRLVYFDGGMGTLLQAMGLKGGERPERWNLDFPERIIGVHQSYLNAGCDVVTANTFGAARAHLGLQAEPCMRAGIQLARAAVKQAGHGFVAADMGSLGRLLSPYGDLPFEDAVSQFREAFAAALAEGADLLLIETMTDLPETKACVLGAKEALAGAGRSVPLLVSLTFDERGRLLTGADIQGTVAMLDALRVDAIGLNCGHEPGALTDNVRELLRCCPLPVFVNPNASLPVMENGKTIYPATPEAFGRDMRAIAELGAWGLGGCCGTTPEHIRALVSATKDVQPVSRSGRFPCVISGRSRSVVLGERPVMIGERLNPTGKRRMKQALLEGDLDDLMRQAVEQCDAGADALDLNVGLPEVDEPSMLPKAVLAVQTVCGLPLQLDTADPVALEAALRVYAGKPIVNSVCGKQKVMDAVFPLVQRYGGAVVALLLDEEGIPDTVEGRLRIAHRILTEAEKYGIAREELLFDALAMTVAANPDAGDVALRTVRALHEELKVKTVLGVSNISFGLPQRPLLTAGFVAMAIGCGLDAAIVNPNDRLVHALFDAACALTGKDARFERYLASVEGEKIRFVFGEEKPASNQPSGDAHDALQSAIERGLPGDAASAAKAALAAGVKPLAVIEDSVMPALARVGERYEKGTLFLPQLLQSANAAQSAFGQVRAVMPPAAAEDGRKVVLATVRGDVHDIGKNIVKVLMQNDGFSVIDLGKDVAPEQVLKAVREHDARLVGLSALMTTTVPAMRETIDLLHRFAPDVPIIVGGAVLTASYAEQIGADGYGKDAMASLRLARKYLGGGKSTGGAAARNP